MPRAEKEGGRSKESSNTYSVLSRDPSVLFKLLLQPISLSPERSVLVLQLTEIGIHVRHLASGDLQCLLLSLQCTQDDQECQLMPRGSHSSSEI